MNTGLSIVVPTYNEEASIAKLHARIKEALRGRVKYEIVFVDDGSTDGTYGILEGLNRADPDVKAVKLSRNFGHEIATSAGLRYASGEAVVVMDSDLQHPPETINELLDKLKEGYDIVFAVRRNREAGSAIKKFCSKAFYGVLGKLSEVKLPDDVTDFMILNRKAADAFLKLKEKSRFFRAMVSWMGFRTAFVPFEEGRRSGGSSKYGLRKLAGLSADVVTGYSIKPLAFVAWAGFIISSASFALLLFYLAKTIFCGASMPGYASMMITILFIGGIQLLSIGIIGQYIGRIYKETQERPLYLVGGLIGLEEKE
ncbi:MAG TPA: glycosyltransferase family 2 protein [Candidatus Omnitrophota bacterium]|nr:glycosyltransferase family 2 protein [Candidatus Omnitrophota bacterium]MDD5737690.1 glycosyltransferase family 2 protein [Candidatus Omnitrophota bacterium]HOX09517.1 glycosyltransferase family 2 protein [Candidatus Omnitrophota bacterium]HPN66649.1 glycosyltransferase family 2 protein [Candidatus Omnitrophota bacterium]HRZ66831.1 glycosyltransferase family 2 protein [Candidatus Omnitrophota bacterium]